MKNSVILLICFLVFVTACLQHNNTQMPIASQNQSHESNSTTETFMGVKDYSALQARAKWRTDALVKELYSASPYSAVYSEMVDTYLIACGLYYDFKTQNLFSSDMKVNYQETIDYFSPFKNHDFVKNLASYLDTENSACSTDVIFHLLQYAISMKAQGLSIENIQSNVFQTDEDFYRFLEALQQFYADTQAEKFFKSSEIHRQLEHYIHKEISAVPIVDYLKMVEAYTGNKDKLFRGSTLHYTSFLSAYKSPYNATFHQYSMKDIYLVSFQSPLGYNGSFDIANMVETAVHESLHPFINPAVEQHQDLILLLSNDKNPGDYASSLYTTMPWHRITDEAVVRVVQARIYGAVSQDYDAAASQLLDKQVQSGWANLYAMYAILEDYEANREQYQQIDSFLPILFSKYFGAE